MHDLSLRVSLFQHKRDATPRVVALDFPEGMDDFRAADARVLRPFLDYLPSGAPEKDPGKNGLLWSPALFNGRRSKASVVSVCALVLDYDYGGDDGIDPDEVVERWAQFTHVLHSTYTPGRYRVVLPYPEPVDQATHDRMYAWALAQDSRLDGSVSDASRAFYWPTYRADLDVDPVFGYNVGELLDPRRIGLDLPRTPVRPESSSSPSFGSKPPTSLVLHGGAPREKQGGEAGGADPSSSPSSRIQSPPSGRSPQGERAEQTSGARPQGAADSPYAGIEHVEQREDLALIESRCAFMRHVRADMHRPDGDALKVTQSEWYAALSIIGRCRGGDDLAHEVSAPYPGYTPEETETTYQRAKVSAGPRTCADIRRHSPACRGCPLQVTSPVLLGRSDEPWRNRQTYADQPERTPAAQQPQDRGGMSDPGSPGGAGSSPAGFVDQPDDDLATAYAEADARYQQARLAEDAAMVAVEGAKRRLALVRADRVSSEDDLTAAVAAVGQAREAHRRAERQRKACERDAGALKKRISVDGLPPGADPAVWQRLRMDREGNPKNVMANLFAVIEGDPRCSSRLAYDAFAEEVLLDNRPLAEDQGSRLVAKLGDDYHLDTSSGSLLEVVRAVALARPRHPIREWLDGLLWDGVPRLKDLLLRGFGANPMGDEELVVRIGEQFVLSLLARAYRAGEKVDTMLVLTGKQGMFKSTSFEQLVGEKWFLSTKLDLHNKDSFIQLRGKWLVEFGELAAVRRADDNVSKGWLTNKVDNYRAPYAKRAEDHPRTTVACGTTNEHEFLQDPTGYRRYRPVNVGRADLGWIQEYREQIFAEACVIRQRGGERAKWWFDEGTEMAERMRRFAAPYQVTHPWTEEVARWLEATINDRTVGEVFSVVTVLTRCLQKNVGDIKREEQTQVGNILNVLGCERVDRDEEAGVVTTRYRRPARMIAAAAKKRGAAGTVTNISVRV